MAGWQIAVVVLCSFMVLGFLLVVGAIMASWFGIWKRLFILIQMMSFAWRMLPEFGPMLPRIAGMLPLISAMLQPHPTGEAQPQPEAEEESI